jgi:hypothetical protein
MNAPVIRISIGKFDADKAVIVEEKLRESRAGLENGIRAMNGNIAYYVGIDRSNNAMHNVRTTPPPNPRASAPTTVPTPAKYVVMEKGMVASSVRKRTRGSRGRSLTRCNLFA